MNITVNISQPEIGIAIMESLSRLIVRESHIPYPSLLKVKEAVAVIEELAFDPASDRISSAMRDLIDAFNRGAEWTKHANEISRAVNADIVAMKNWMEAERGRCRAN